jgi:lysophospholipase L1-like esterase
MATTILGGTVFSLGVAEFAARRIVIAKSLGTVGIFPPRAKVSFHTSEFAYTAEANSKGFRGPEPSSEHKVRIVAIGDSFTYGWGLELEATWPRLLEKSLRGHGLTAEVLNLGCPGASADVYAEVAERATPLLKPDLVLICVLQGDDLKQLARGGTMERLAGAQGGLAILLERISKPKAVSAAEVTAEWQLGTQRITAHLAPEEQTRLEVLDWSVREKFFAGDLSPHLLTDTLKDPRYLEFTLDASNPELQAAIATMAHHFGRIRNVSERAKAKALVLSVPWAYVSQRAIAAKRKLGFLIEDNVINSDAPDDAIRNACKAARLEFHSFTKRFRDEARQRSLFFELDGHFNADGAALYAEEVSKFLLEQSPRSK